MRELDDAGEAFRRIAASKSTFVLNNIDGVRYLTEILWNAAGKPDRTGWFLDEGHRKDGAIERASEMDAYSFWGLTPFVRVNGQAPLKLEPARSRGPASSSASSSRLSCSLRRSRGSTPKVRRLSKLTCCLRPRRRGFVPSATPATSACVGSLPVGTIASPCCRKGDRSPGRYRGLLPEATTTIPRSSRLRR